MNRIHSKNDRIKTYEINAISLSCSDVKFIFLITEFMRRLLVLRTNDYNLTTICKNLFLTFCPIRAEILSSHKIANFWSNENRFF